MRKVLLVDLGEFVREVLKSLDSARDKSHATLVALRGDLGAGKTTFVQALAKELGVRETVQSPTYVLMKKYQIPNQGDALTPKLFKASPFLQLVHIDLYRLEKPEEFAALKPEEFLKDSKNLVCIEWPERAGNLLLKPVMIIKFSSEGASENERYYDIS